MTAAGPHQHPAWFGAVMGTGALALALAAQASTWGVTWLTTVAAVVLVAASVLALLLLPRYARRLGNRTALSTEIAHPAQGAMLATLPAGMLVLAVGWGRIGPSMIPTTAALWINGILLVLGVVIALPLGLAWSASMLRSAPGLDGVNGGWLIPPVMNLIVALALTPLIVANPATAPLLLLIGLAFLGIGTVLFMAILTLLVARLALHDPVPPAMAPTMWIPLAPAGMIGLALMRLLESAETAGVVGVAGGATGLVVATMGIGFGLWWAAFAVLETRRMQRASGIPTHPGWLGFVFPIAAMTLSITAVGAATDVSAVKWAGALATVLVGVVWAYVAARTLGMLRSGATPPQVLAGTEQVTPTP